MAPILRSAPARRALQTLGYAPHETGGGCVAYARFLGEASSMIVTAGDCVLPTRVRGERISVGFYDEEARGATLEFVDLAAFLYAPSGWTAFEAWRDAMLSARHVVITPAAILEWLARRRAPLGLVTATTAVVRAGETAQLVLSGDDAWLLGLFGPSLASLDLSAYGFWAGPGAWISVFDGR